MPRELWVTNTSFGGRPAEAAVAVKFLHKAIPRQKSPEKTGTCEGGRGRGVVSDRAYNIWPFFTLQGGVSCPSNDIQDTTAYS